MAKQNTLTNPEHTLPSVAAQPEILFPTWTAGDNNMLSDNYTYSNYGYTYQNRFNNEHGSYQPGIDHNPIDDDYGSMDYRCVAEEEGQRLETNYFNNRDAHLITEDFDVENPWVQMYCGVDGASSHDYINGAVQIPSSGKTGFFITNWVYNFM
ncbi:hypothetical protein FRC09_006132 [Ceratobasidium sp. 395]|nr:hypothetical protein FRC09_006132 [Ceratobasidium sp. 395]